MLKSHELLLKFHHDSRFEFAKVRVCYIDRGAPRDCTCAEGNTIPVLAAYYFEVKSQAGLKIHPLPQDPTNPVRRSYCLGTA